MVQSEGCNISIPNMPTIKGKARALHNLIYNPGSKELLVCNSISDSKKTTCDSWKPGKSSWTLDHSSPHKEDNLREIQKNLWASIGSSDFGYGSSAKPKTMAESRCGRYAASSLTLQGTGVVIGGSTSCDGTHTVTPFIYHRSVKVKRFFSQSTQSSSSSQVVLMVRPIGRMLAPSRPQDHSFVLWI